METERKNRRFEYFARIVTKIDLRLLKCQRKSLAVPFVTEFLVRQTKEFEMIAVGTAGESSNYGFPQKRP